MRELGVAVRLGGSWWPENRRRRLAGVGDELDGYGAPQIDCLGEEGHDGEALLWGCSAGPRRRRSSGERRGGLRWLLWRKNREEKEE